MNRERIEAKVSDREALAAALDNQQNLTLATAADLIRIGILPTKPSEWEGEMRDRMVVFDAARERLAQLPEKCGNAWPDYEPELIGAKLMVHPIACACNGSGKGYPAELVERIAKAMHDSLTPVAVTRDQQTEGVREVYGVKAVAVLDALNGETE